MVRLGKIDPLHMATHRIKLDEIDIGYHKFHYRAKGAQKIFVEIKLSEPAAPESLQLSSFGP